MTTLSTTVIGGEPDYKAECEALRTEVARLKAQIDAQETYGWIYGVPMIRLKSSPTDYRIEFDYRETPPAVVQKQIDGI